MQKLDTLSKILIPICIVLFAALIFVTQSNLAEQNNAQTVQESIGYSGTVKVLKNGEPWDSSSNVLYNNGADMIRDFLGTATGTSPVTTIAVCNATASGSGSPLGCELSVAEGTETFIAYDTCGLSNVTGTFSPLESSTSGSNWSVQHTFTVDTGCFGLLINATRLQNGSDIFAGNNFNLLNLSETDTFTINWTISET